MTRPNIFIDNDVILDVLLERKDFEYSQSILVKVEQKQAVAYTSPIIFTNSFYIVSRLRSRDKAWSALKKIRLLLRVATITEKIIDQALASEFRDFEDAVQYYAALTQGADYLVTRNKKDYVGDQVLVVSPQEFLAVSERPQI